MTFIAAPQTKNDWIFLFQFSERDFLHSGPFIRGAYQIRFCRKMCIDKSFKQCVSDVNSDCSCGDFSACVRRPTLSLLSECPGSRGWPYLCVRTAWSCVFSSFFCLSSLSLLFLHSHRWVPVSFPFACACKTLHVGFFFFSSLFIHIPLLFSSCLSCWNDCACWGKLSSLDTWHCLSVFTNLVGPRLAVVTIL